MFIWILFFSLTALAGFFDIPPALTGTGIQQIKGPHRVGFPTNPNGKILITVGGTNSSPLEFKTVHQWALELGYVVMGIDYPNTVISTTCYQTFEPTDCYDRYRQEIVFGDEVSDQVAVDKTQSLSFRISKLVEYLKIDEFDWSTVVLVGHSQGAGHVAYLAKFHAVKKVIMTGGPHDYYKGNAASWLLREGYTNRADFYAFLHEKDFFGVDTQISASRALMVGNETKTLSIQNDIPIGSDAQIFVSTSPFADPHNSLALPFYVNVWRFLLHN